MTIAVDGNEANVAHPVGVSVYTIQLLKYFAYTANRENMFIVYLRQNPLPHMPKENDYYRYRIAKGRLAWLHTALPIALYLDRRADVFFSPAHYAPKFCPVPLVVTIHDLAYFYYPDEFLKKDLYKLIHWTRDSIERASRIIAVSKTTKRDVVNHYHVAEDKVSVVYNGYEKLPPAAGDSKLPEIEGKALQDKSYILYVGTIQPRKNITTLLKGFASFLPSHPGMKLVITGKKGWMYERVYQTAEELGLKDSVVFTGYLPDETVVQLYAHALCYVLPSLYEGFGIPILEAMAHKCPVIASTVSSLPEVGGDACLYFDARDPKDLAGKLTLLATDAKLRASLIREGQRRIKQFSWQACARETLEILKAA